MNTKIKSADIQQQVYQWALARDFTAPYGVLTGAHTNKKGTKYLAVTFGRARSLDATVEIYNRNFIVVRTNQHGSQVFKDVASMQQFLDTL